MAPKETEEFTEFSGRKPDFKDPTGGVAVWMNTDKNGNEYLSIKMVGHEKIVAFKN